MNFEHLISVTGTITDITIQEGDCCSQNISMEVEGQPVNMILNADTLVVDSMRLMPGMRIAAFYDAMQPVPLIYPPQYRAMLITVLRQEEDVSLSWFDETMTAYDQSLKLNLHPCTSLWTLNGQAYQCSPANHYLLVYYSATTRSIPPQTSPSRVIVLC